MAAKARKRRSPGEGSVWEYRTQARQVRYAIGFTTTAPDGSVRNVTRRRGPGGEKWTTYRDAAKALRDALGQIDKGEWVDPSRQPLGDYLDEWTGRAPARPVHRRQLPQERAASPRAVPRRPCRSAALTAVRIDAHVPPAGGQRSA